MPQNFTFPAHRYRSPFLRIYIRNNNLLLIHHPKPTCVQIFYISIPFLHLNFSRSLQLPRDFQPNLLFGVSVVNFAGLPFREDGFDFLVALHASNLLALGSRPYRFLIISRALVCVNNPPTASVPQGNNSKYARSIGLKLRGMVCNT